MCPTTPARPGSPIAGLRPTGPHTGAVGPADQREAELRRRRRRRSPVPAEEPQRDLDHGLIANSDCTTYPEYLGLHGQRYRRPMRSTLPLCIDCCGTPERVRQAERATLDLQRPAERGNLDGHGRRHRHQRSPKARWNGWTLQINHANPTITASSDAGLKVKKQVRHQRDLRRQLHREDRRSRGRRQRPSSPPTAPGLIIAPATKKAQKKGKGQVTLTATDQTGGTATTTVNAKTIKTKPKK